MSTDTATWSPLVLVPRARKTALVLPLLLAGMLFTPALPTRAADGFAGSCLDATTLPCSASAGQTYGEVTLGASGNDDHASVAAVLRAVVGDVTIGPLATGMTADSGSVDLTPDKVAGVQRFDWSYAGDSTGLGYITVKAGNAFAVFGVAGTSAGSIDVGELLGGHDISHIGLWAIDASTVAPVRANKLHGRHFLETGFLGNARLGRIANGTVPCMHVETAEVARCRFKHRSGAWLESASGDHAVSGQNIALDGSPGGEYVIAAQVNLDGSVPAIEPTGQDSSGTASGMELAGACMLETMLSSGNASGEPLRNHATLEVPSNVYPHPDGATFVGSPSPGIYAYTGRGAGLNDINGTERDEFGVYYGNAATWCHVVWSNGYEVPAAKRPATGGWPTRVYPNSPIVWRPVTNQVSIAN